jgi:thiol-disulfide isomerase/thioredoxin
MWRLEFKAIPPAGHPALRTRIARDLARLEKVPERDSLRWLVFLRHGYQNAGDLEAADRIAGEILAKHPQSDTAKWELLERWKRDRPYPAGKDLKEVAGWARAASGKFAEWVRIWPDDSFLYHQWFSAALDIPETPAVEVGRMGDKLAGLYAANPNWSIFPSLEYRVADAFLKKDVNVAKVPKLIEEGDAREEKRHREMLANDRLEDEFRKMSRSGMEGRRIERARIMLTYYARTGNPEPARAIEAELAALQPGDPQVKANLLERRAQAAELLGRKLDALVLNRAALAVRPKAPQYADPLKENLERLWKELGGTPAAYAFLLDRSKPAEASGLRWEKPRKPAPEFSVFDLNGQTWTLAGLKGKVVLINVWATWCGPCRAEHPAFQKLYDELKPRPDVAVISFNVDDEIGKVAPYLQEHKYTFPVLLARDVVDQVLDVVTIPQNWFLNRNGVLEAMQVGFGGETGWREQKLAKLEEIVTAR